MRSQPIARIATVACILVLAGCASQRPVAGAARTGDREEAIAAAEAEITRLEAALRSSGAEAAPDCPRVCGLVATICGLAKKICDLANQAPAELQRRCADAAPRCERARASAAPRCDCRPDR
jgi:hypothetical protein